MSRSIKLIFPEFKKKKRLKNFGSRLKLNACKKSKKLLRNWQNWLNWQGSSRKKKRRQRQNWQSSRSRLDWLLRQRLRQKDSDWKSNASLSLKY